MPAPGARAVAVGTRVAAPTAAARPGRRRARRRRAECRASLRPPTWHRGRRDAGPCAALGLGGPPRSRGPGPAAPRCEASDDGPDVEVGEIEIPRPARVGRRACFR